MTTQTQNTKPRSQPTVEITYEDFGRTFFEYTVTRQRIASALSGLTGNEVDFGPRTAGPGNVARITGQGRVGEVQVAPNNDELIRFDVAIPIDIQLDVRLAGQSHKFNASMSVKLVLTARARAPLRIYIDIDAPTEDDVQVELQAQGLRASVLNIVANIDEELRRYVAHYVGQEIDKPEIREMRDIDIARRVDDAQ